MPTEPLISVIMPAYDASAHLPRAVASVRRQTRKDWELLISDDGSRDNTVALARSFAQHDPRIKVLTKGDHDSKGAAAARNRAISHASGRFLAFLDADDEWLPEKLDRQVGLMLTEGAALTFTGFWRQKAERRHEVKVPSRVIRRDLLKGNVMGTLTVICDRCQLGEITFPLLALRQDYALWLDLLHRTDAAIGLQAPLAVSHVTQGSLSSNRWRATRATWHVYRQHAGLGPLASGYYLTSHLARRLRRG